VKNRNRAQRRRRWSAGKNLPNLFPARNPRKRKPFTFETLEPRLAFSVAPMELQTTSLSSDTPEGAAAIFLRELQWAALQSASMNGTLDLRTRQLPTDPYFPDPTDTSPDPFLGGQWHLLNIGQQVGNPDFEFIYGVPGEDINVVPAWELGYTGEGVIVAVIDDGVQTNHPDLAGNINAQLGFNAITGAPNGNPASQNPGPHGTAVAGLIGATWSNEAGIPVTGGVGVAPEVTLVPIKMLGNAFTTYNGLAPEVNALRHALMIGADITNNSWGPPDIRHIAAADPAFIQLLRDSVLFGRDGLGMIHVFAAGNGGGTFAFGGSRDSATYDPYVSSRYVIGVTAIDHDGLYSNEDGIAGTISAFAEAGANVLVAAPSGTSIALNIANDDGLGSGLWTTDLRGEFGYNNIPDPRTGIDDDRDFLNDADYTTRFGGTSGAAPIVSGVIALMLEANPNLTYRDVQEILVRSARQNAQFEIPATPTAEASFSTWQTNPMLPYRDPDSWNIGVSPFLSRNDPIADPTLDSFPYSSGFSFGGFISEGNDFQRQRGHYELQPAEFTNGAGYTVSQGYGAYGELIGYAHGVVDAELAVIMARDWHALNQEIPARTEKTYTTFVTPVGGAYELPPAEKGDDAIGGFLVPGGIGGDTGFIAFYEEYVADPPRPFDPADPSSWPSNSRGFSYIDFKVPVSQQINVETVEVKLTISGPAEDVNFLKINLTSPSGMQSELNHYYQDITFRPNSLQDRSEPADGWAVGGLGPLADSDTFTWTFLTNRNWGESTNSAVIMNPLTGEPQAGPSEFFSDIPQPIFRDWELHLENWSDSPFTIDDIEIVWHGKPIAGGQLDQEWIAQDPDWEVPVAQRIQGFVGIDLDGDDEFSGIDPTRDNEWNNRYIQNFFGDPTAPRQTELVRRLLDDYEDNNSNGVFDEGDVREMEPYAANILLEAFEFTVDAGGNDIVNPQPIAQFLTGADGNYYFDLVPGNYVIRATDRNDIPGTFVDDFNTPDGFLQHYKDEWRITADWFYAPDRDDPIDIDGFGQGDMPGEIFYDDVAQAPVAFRFDPAQPRIPKAVTDLNFLVKPQETPVLNVQVSGTVYADVNGNGAVDFFDGAASATRVYVDSIRNGQFDPGEQFVYTDAAGNYSLTVLTSTTTVVVIGVDLQPGWQPSIPGGNLHTLLVKPGMVLTDQDFFLNPPDDPTGSGLGNITGFVFNDLDADGIRDLNEGGLANVTVFIDADLNGDLDNGEIAVLTGANGAYFIPNLTAGSYRVDAVLSEQQMTTPTAGYHSVNLASGETRNGVAFGVKNLAYRDFGDLPDSFDLAGIPSHIVVPHFRLGESIDADLAHMNSPNADLDLFDDGVEIVSNGGKLQPGVNILRVQTFGAGGQLVGWIDWDGGGSFDANDRLTFIDHTTGENLGIEADLPPTGLDGILLRIIADDDFAFGAKMAMRFRWGEVGLTLSSESIIGEIEDYIVDSTDAAPPTLGGDFNDDGAVNAADYVAFRKFFGTSFVLPNTTDPGQPLVAADETLWRTNFGGTDPGSSPAPSAPASAPLLAGTGASPNELGIRSYASPSPVSVREGDDGATATDDGPSSMPVFFGPVSDLGRIAPGTSLSAYAQRNAVDTGARSSADELLLLDQAIAELDERDAQAPLADRKADDQGYDDLALAAAFEDETTWWSA